MAREGRGNNPSMMRLVQPFIYRRPMEDPMDNVDEKVGEPEEQSRRGDDVGYPAGPAVPERRICDALVHQRVTPAFPKEPRQGHNVQYREAGHAHLDFQADLVLEEARMPHHSLIV